MEQFVMVSLAHFMALLLPGPDFFLIIRTTIRSGWRSASGACLGITLANGVFIACAFSGVSVFHHESSAMLTVQWAGLVYLFYLGLLFIRSARLMLPLFFGVLSSLLTRSFCAVPRTSVARIAWD